MRSATLLFLLLLMVVPAASGDDVPAQLASGGDTAEWSVRRIDGGRASTITMRQIAEGSDEWFVSSMDLADMLGVGRFWRPDVRKLVLRIDDRRITFTVEARSVVGDDDTILLRQPVLYFEGEPWVPLEFLLDERNDLAGKGRQISWAMSIISGRLRAVWANAPGPLFSA